MKIINWIFDLSASKKKKHSPEIKRKINEIILLDRFEKESNKKTSPTAQECV
jgi:hypothetical protein